MSTMVKRTLGKSVKLYRTGMVGMTKRTSEWVKHITNWHIILIIDLYGLEASLCISNINRSFLMDAQVLYRNRWSRYLNHIHHISVLFALLIHSRLPVIECLEVAGGAFLAVEFVYQASLILLPSSTKFLDFVLNILLYCLHVSEVTNAFFLFTFQFVYFRDHFFIFIIQNSSLFHKEIILFLCAIYTTVIWIR